MDRREEYFIYSLSTLTLNELDEKKANNILSNGYIKVPLLCP